MTVDKCLLNSFSEKEVNPSKTVIMFSFPNLVFVRAVIIKLLGFLISCINVPFKHSTNGLYMFYTSVLELLKMKGEQTDKNSFSLNFWGFFYDVSEPIFRTNECKYNFLLRA